MAFTRSHLSKLKKDELIDLLLEKEASQLAVSPDESLLQAYIKEIIQLSPDPLLLINPENMQLQGCNWEALQLMELDNEEGLKQYLDNMLRERPMYYDILDEMITMLSEEPEISMEIEFSTATQHLRYGDMVCRKVKVMGRPFLMLRVVDITEVKQSHIRVLDSEKQLEMAQEIAKVGSYIYKQESGDFQFSKAFSSLHGLAVKDRTPKSLRDLLSYVLPSDRPALLQLIRELYRNRKGFSTEFRVSSNQGTQKQLICITKPDLDDQGKIQKVMVTLQDNTERVMTNQRLKESEERYRLTVENTNDGVWYWDFKSLKGYMSPKFEKNLGFEDDVITPESIEKWFSKVHPEERAAYRKQYEACVAGVNDSFRMEFRYKDLDGKYMWVESGATLVRDEYSEPHYLLGTIRIINDRKQVELQLKEQERFLKMAQRVAQVGSWIWDKASDSLKYSEELYYMLELDTSIVGREIGKEVIKMVAEEDKEMVDRFVDESQNLQDDEQHIMEAKIYLPSGKIKVMRTIGRVYQRNTQGDITKLIGITQDITNDKRREQELVEAKEQAEVSRQAKDHFLQIVSHEIRNPLNAIVGITRLLEQAPLGTKELEQVETLSFSAHHLLSIINDILDTAKLQYGKITLDQVPFTLQEQLLHAEELFRPLAADQETEVYLQWEDGLPEVVVGDPTRFNQIIFNLLSNAVKHTFRGKIFLKCRLLKERKHAYLLEFIVTDTGTGIPDQNLERVFEAFEQQGLLTGQQKGGTGLGLYIVKELVDLMGGEIEVDSELGVGTTLTFSVCFGKPDLGQETNSDRYKKQPLNLSDKSVLYVEDATYNQLLLKGYAQMYNLHLDVADSVEEALDKAAGQVYDLVLTDYQLPDGTGIDVASGLKEIIQHAKVPVIAISAYHLEEKSEEYPFDDYLRKPINFDKFFYVLRKYLKGQMLKPPTEQTASGFQASGALEYLKKHKPEQYFKVIDNLDDELAIFSEQLTYSIESHHYYQYLLAVHKLSGALKMLGEENLLDFLQNIEDLPEDAGAKSKMIQKVRSEIACIQKKCVHRRKSGKEA